MNEYVQALEERVQYFHEIGGRISDHGLGEIPFASYEESELEQIFQAGRNGEQVSLEDENKFKTAVTSLSCKMLQKERLGNANTFWCHS